MRDKHLDAAFITLIAVFVISLLAAAYISTEQRAECVEINATKPADDIVKICGKA